MLLTYRATERDAGRRVYLALKNDLHLSAGGIKRLKYAHAVFVNGESVYMDRLLAPGDVLTADITLSEPEPDFPPEQGELEILYEDGGLLAVNKPPGLLVHPSRGRYTGTLANYVSGYLLDTAGSPVCHAVNRLDRDTSGVTLFAKSAHHKALAVEALRRPEAEKVYTALLFGVLPEPEGVIDLPIDREREGFQRRVVRDTGKRAVTLYKTEAVALLRGQRVSRVRLTLKTGRTHQIRVHCAHLGAPVLGDRLYGAPESLELADELRLPRHLLHAARLSLTDPATGLPLVISAGWESVDMRSVMAGSSPLPPPGFAEQ